ncbi:MAG: cytochrome c [Sulfuricaulis sp.]|nr:cytochrome c [Sulfuricaulis sp.]
MATSRAILIAGATLLAVFAIPAPAAETPRDRGEYLFRAAGCHGCHTDEKNKGPALAGGPALKTAFGTFYAPNITPDSVHGIGRWSEADFIHALREGVSPTGEHYYPTFPYTSYTRLTDADLRALWGYLRRQPPVTQASKPHQLPWYLRARPLMIVWKIFFFSPGQYAPRPGKDEIWNRGAYLAESVVHCGECHTPRNLLGAARRDRYFAGTRAGPENSVVPNITPDKKTGIGRWRKNEIAEYLDSGMTPAGDSAGDLMAEVIDHSTSLLTQADRGAIATYLLSLPPIENVVRKEKGKSKGRDEFGF